uniref:Integrase catalytic domain-containing protein n=1 Tax=Cannabis sativa TaxID=3483 RepID=A0A803PRL4_CANSA
MQWSQSISSPNGLKLNLWYQSLRKEVLHIMIKNIICTFTIPIKIVPENGTQFDGDVFSEFCKRNKINKSFSSVSRPQANGQVEVVNKTLKDTIKKKLDAPKGRWVEELR